MKIRWTDNMGDQSTNKPSAGKALTSKWSATGKDGIFTSTKWTCDPEFTFSYNPPKGAKYEGPQLTPYGQLEALLD